MRRPVEHTGVMSGMEGMTSPRFDPWHKHKVTFKTTHSSLTLLHLSTSVLLDFT